MATKTNNLGLSKAELTDAVRSTLIANNGNFDKIDDQITRLKANQIQGTSSGTEIVIQDSAKIESVIQLSGNSEQDSRSGKNLLNPIREGSTKNGLTMTNNGDGSYTIKGTATQNTSFSLAKLSEFPINLISGKTYILSRTIIAGSIATLSITIGVKDENENILYNYITAEANTRTPTKNYIINNFDAYIGNGGTVDCTFKVQLEEGTEATEWEPYGVQPSPDYPSEIRSVSGDVEVKVEGKNLLEKNTFDNPYINGSASYDKATNTITYLGASGHANGIYVPIENQKIGKTYTFSCYIKGATGRKPLIRYAGKDQIPVLTGDWQRCSQTVTVTAEVNNIAFYSNDPANGGMQKGDTLQIKDWQIEEGSTATTYQPYGDETISLPLGDIELRSTPDGTRDTFARVDGVWNKVEKMPKYVFTGKESGYLNTTKDDSKKRCVIEMDLDIVATTTPQDVKPMLSNIGSSISRGDTYNLIDGFAYDTSKKIIAYFEEASSFTKYNDFLQWLVSKNAYIIPLLATPTYTPITDQALISALDELEQLILHKGYNRITATAVNGVKAYLDLSYVKDINMVLENLISRIGGAE